MGGPGRSVLFELICDILAAADRDTTELAGRNCSVWFDLDPDKVLELDFPEPTQRPRFQQNRKLGVNANCQTAFACFALEAADPSFELV